MTDRLLLSTLYLRPAGTDQQLTLGWFDAEGHYQVARATTDLNLGHIMTAFSSCVKRIQAVESGLPALPTTEIGGPMTVTHWTIEDLTIAPYRWHMLMRTDRFSYAVNMDRDLEHVILAFAGALKFFCFKHGLSTLDDEVARNRDRAGEAGLLTKEDFSS